MMNLRTIVEKTADADILREIIRYADERLMKHEVDALTGAGPWREIARSAFPGATAGETGPTRHVPAQSVFAS